ncbi:Glycosyl phosphatidyl inositol protein transamidase complex subunit [Friedmanniomyces endolithicus]|nr:Glycosyl phosphatidyl inositol protein transamidase complex subunit [Friedmanniomyces endolithicus]
MALSARLLTLRNSPVLLKLPPYLSALCIVIGIAWLFILPLNEYSRQTYVSENAILPGQVHTYFGGSEHNVFRAYRQEVYQISQVSETDRLAALENVLREIGLKVAAQPYRFTVAGEDVEGTNVYGLLQGPRADATEAMVLMAAWLNFEGEINYSGLALALTLARYFKRWSIWSKDIILLIPADSTYGPEAWVSAYHSTSPDITATRNVSSLPIKAGALQAAVALDYPVGPWGHRFDKLDILYDGINGALPNLDLLNTAVAVASGQMGIGCSIHGILSHSDSYRDRLTTLAKGVVTQSAGQATGPHSAFVPYHVDAITLKTVGDGWHDEMSLGRTTESLFRSINNLLEHLHQSFFFYILLNANRFASIGNYLPAAMLLQAWRSQPKYHSHTIQDTGLLLDRANMAQVLLRHWVPRYLLLDDGAAAEPHDHGVFKRINLGSVAQKATSAAIGHESTSASEEHTDPLIGLLVTLAKWTKGYAIFLQDLLDMLGAVQTRPEVWATFDSIRRHPELGIPATFAKTLVLYLTATGNPAHLSLAWKVYEAVPSLSVMECIDFPLQLIEHGLGTPDRIFHLLNSKVGPEIVKPEFRATPRLALQPAQVDLAHLVAYAWAKQEHTSSRVAFRRVWEVYRFLQDRGAPLSPLMSRSLVRAGIAQPMQEGKNVSLAQVKYIIAIVQRLEGKEAAAYLDRLVWPINKRLRDPSNPAAVARLSWWAGRMDDGIARRMRWRLKLWTKKKRGWFDGDGPLAKRRRSKDVQSANADDTELFATMLPPAVDVGTEQTDWRQIIGEDVEASSSGELVEIEASSIPCSPEDAASAYFERAEATTTPRVVLEARKDKANFLPQDPLVSYDPVPAWSDAADATNPDLGLTKLLLTDKSFVSYDPAFAWLEADDAVKPDVEPAKVPLTEYSPASYDLVSARSHASGPSSPVEASTRVMPTSLFVHNDSRPPQPEARVPAATTDDLATVNDRELEHTASADVPSTSMSLPVTRNTGHVELEYKEGNASGWRNFSQRWQNRRKRSKYDTYAKQTKQ